MKAKNILMTLLLVTGAIAAKAAGYPPELALVSQPVMVYNANSITVYYDVENIGDYTYRGNVCLYLYPDEGYSYAEEWVKVRPGRIKRIAIDIPAYRIRKGHPFTIMPYYEMGDELYSFTTFEYFEPITFYWEGPRNERWVVIHIGPRPTYYHRPGHYRYYYDGFRPPMPPPGLEPRPMDPKHHTYSYHHNNGGYPAPHNGEGHGPKPTETPKPNGSETPNATVHPKPNSGSMSHGYSGTSDNITPSTPNGGNNTGSSRKPSSGSNISRPSSSGSSGNTSRPSGTSKVSRPSSSSASSSSSVSRPSSSSSSSGRVGNSSSTSRPSGTSSSASSSTSARKSSSSSSSNNSSSTRSGSSSGRR